ncbi:MAG: NAD(P)-dependent oxidoreductase [Candidatus Omnitrophica bacterium]|nr:NAD(P)-dependent oxidoreductase [Candidatus Omnitrophota bacterium]
MNILILGGAGFVGNNLVRRCLREKKHNLTVVDSLDARLKSDIEFLNEERGEIEFIQADMRDSRSMDKIVEGKDVIFNCAAQSSHPMSFVDPAYDIAINCTGNITLLEAVRRHNKRALVIYASSSTVIGKALTRVVNEKHQELPLDIYSANKGVAEKYYYIYNRVYDLKTLVLRFANLYGPYGKASPEFGFINYFIHRAFSGKEISIYGKGSQIRNVMYVEDACDLLYQAIFHKEIFGGIYFAVHREHYSVRKIAEEIVSAFGKGKVVTVAWPEIRKRIEIDDVIISGAKLYNKLQWKPRFTLRQGLLKTKEIMEEYKSKRGDI